jgi:hypothetical protein
MKKIQNKSLWLAVALVLGVVGAQNAFADVNIATPGPSVSVGGNNGYFDNNYNWGGNKDWRCVARGRDDRRYRDTGSDRDKARDHALNYCERHTSRCEIQSCDRIH